MLWARRRIETIRHARIADVTAVSQLLSECWHDTYDGILGPEAVERISREWHSVERLATQIDQLDTAFLVAEQRGQMIGTGFAHLVSRHEVEIGRLYVHPRHQRRQTGARLLSVLIESFPMAQRFLLEVEPRNQGAVRFYERRGFVTTGLTQDCGTERSNMRALVLQLLTKVSRPPHQITIPNRREISSSTAIEVNDT